MTQIVLTEEQALALAAAQGPVELRSSQGGLLARFEVAPQEWFTPAEIEAAKRSRETDQPRYSSQQIQSLLARLTELDEQEGMDTAKVEAALARFRAGEAV